MAKMIQVPYANPVLVPQKTAQAVQKKDNENPISLEALGLLVNLLSYPTTWELHKTELYKRYAKHGERSVKSAWNDLVENKYIVEFKYRTGKKYEYVYYFRKVPFTAEEKAEILDSAVKEYGEIWGLQNEDPKMETSERRDNQEIILNKETILNTKEPYIDKLDDDKRTESSAIHNDESINLIISNLREVTKEELSDRSYNTVVRKVVDKYSQGKVTSFRDYLVTALIKKIEELEIRRQKEDAKQKMDYDQKKRTKNRIRNSDTEQEVPFYNWLEQ